VENFPYYYKIVRDKISAYLRGEKKLYVFLASIFFVVVLIGFISPSLLQNKKNSWDQALQKKLTDIQTTSLSLFEERQAPLIETANTLRDLSRESKNLSLQLFQSKLLEDKFSGYQIFLLDSTDTEIATNTHSGLTGKDIWDAKTKIRSTFFRSTPLLTLLCYADQIHIQGKSYFLITATIFETDYLEEDMTPENNFSAKLEDTFESEVEVIYSPSRAKSLDGRYLSIDIPNNLGQKIGLITVAKPTLKAELKTLRANTNKAQSLFIIAGIILLGFILQHETKQLKLPLIKPLLVILFLVIVRWMLFLLNFPADYFPEELTNPNFFSSAFAGGIVKSPLEFLVTASFFCFLVFYLYNISKRKIADFFGSRIKVLPLRLGIALLSVFILLLSIRGIAAAVKSVVFDSSLRYFDTADIIPGIPHLVMHIAIFLVALSAIVFNQILLKIFYSSLPKNLLGWRKILFSALVILPSSAIFVLVQKQPLVSMLLFGFATILTVVVFFVTEFKETKTLKYLLIISFASSILTISFMNYFNTELEKEEVKRTAIFLSRSQESYLNFLLNESLSKIVRQSKLMEFSLSPSTNFSALSLKLWLESSLRNEKVLSSITLLDKRKKILGYFSCGVKGEQLIPQIAQASLTRELQIFDISDKSSSFFNKRAANF